MVMPVLQFQGRGAGMGYMQGAQAGSNLVNQLFNAPFQQAMARSKLASQREALAQQQLQTQMAPESMQAKLAQMAAETGLLQAKAPLTQAQTGLAQEELRLMPLTSALKAQAALSELGNQQRLSSRFGPAYSLSRSLARLPKASQAAWIAENQEAYNEMMMMQGQAVLNRYSQSPQRNILTREFLASMGLPVGEETGAFPAPQQDDRASQVAVDNSYADDPSFKNTPEIVEITRKAAEMAGNRDLTTTTTKVRREAGEALDSLLNNSNVRETFQTLAQYQGVQGQLKAASERFTDPEAYAKYESAYTQMPTVISGSLKALEAFGATDKGLETGLEFFRRATKLYSTDPAASIEYFNKGIDILNAESEALKETASPLYDVDRLGEQPIQQLPSPGTLTVPPFDTKSDWQNWYKGLSKEQRFQYQQQREAKK